jgi:glycosyltransferase involved in cell wall biosynthesis
MNNSIRLSVIVPLFNEEESVQPLVERVRQALAEVGDWELVLVDDGSRDSTAVKVRQIAAGDGRIRLVQLARNYGQTQAMQAGFDSARGDIVVSMDGDLQNDPMDIMRLVDALDHGYDLAAGYRQSRKDKLLTRKIPSWVANRIIRRITRVNIRDNGCSLKAYRRTLLVSMRLYSDLHRFIPAVAAATAGARVVEVPVRHHPRRFGTSKYGLSRILKVVADLLVITMITRFRERPLLMFGLGGMGAFALGVAFAAASVTALLKFGENKANAYVLPGAVFLWTMLGIYLFLLGLIAEIVLRRAEDEESVRQPRMVNEHG